MNKHKKVIFIGATDTDVGKTLISGLLVDYLRRQGVGAGYQKWTATGCREGDEPEDLRTIKTLTAAGNGPIRPAAQAIGGGGEDPDSALDLAVPYRFRLPASPHLAAAEEGREIDPEVVKSRFAQALAAHEVLIVEGAGGLMVPLTRQLLLIDLVAELRLPTLLVARSGLGTINHSLLSLEALRHRSIPVLGLICTDEEPNPPEIIVNDNIPTIAALGRVQVLGRLPRCVDRLTARTAFATIGAEIHTRLARM
ncbi:MAG: dethiobiotin synthase [Desulfobulbaceae bacterium]|nr:MAG: dethiobiotin synthase [Desulfobulbaceae bacterium]